MRESDQLKRKKSSRCRKRLFCVLEGEAWQVKMFPCLSFRNYLISN